jgi:hypothetical protein
MMSFLKLHNQMQNDKLWKLRQDYLKEMKKSSFFDLNTKTSSNAIKLKAPKMDKILYSNKKTTLIKDLIDTRYESMPKRKTVISVQDAAGVSKRPNSTPSGKKTSSITTYNAASTYEKPVELDWFAPKFQPKAKFHYKLPAAAKSAESLKLHKWKDALAASSLQEVNEGGSVVFPKDDTKSKAEFISFLQQQREWNAHHERQCLIREKTKLIHPDKNDVLATFVKAQQTTGPRSEDVAPYIAHAKLDYGELFTARCQSPIKGDVPIIVRKPIKRDMNCQTGVNDSVKMVDKYVQTVNMPNRTTVNEGQVFEHKLYKLITMQTFSLT